MAIATNPLTPHYGVEVTGIDLNTVTAEHLFPQLRALFEEHSALLFRSQDMTDETHLRIAGYFGPIEDRQADERKPDESFQIPKVSNVMADGTTSDAMDLKTLNLKANFLWHSDSTFMPEPALTNILTARVVTTEGGATELASTRAAWARMPEALRKRIRGRGIYGASEKPRAPIGLG